MCGSPKHLFNQSSTISPLTVMGLKMEHGKLLGFMSDISMCNDSDGMVCYLLDDGGFVIATNQEDKYAQV